MQSVKQFETQTGLWQVAMYNSCLDEPLTCIGALCLPCVQPYRHRMRLIENAQAYTCFGGICGDDCCRSTTSHAPELCLCCETVLCLPFAIAGNRFLYKRLYLLRNDTCDKAVFGASYLCWPCAGPCKCNCPFELANVLHCLFVPCEVAQHESQYKACKTRAKQRPFGFSQRQSMQ